MNGYFRKIDLKSIGDSKKIKCVMPLFFMFEQNKSKLVFLLTQSCSLLQQFDNCQLFSDLFLFKGKIFQDQKVQVIAQLERLLVLVINLGPYQ